MNEINSGGTEGEHAREKLPRIEPDLGASPAFDHAEVTQGPVPVERNKSQPFVRQFAQLLRNPRHRELHHARTGYGRIDLGPLGAAGTSAVEQVLLGQAEGRADLRARGIRHASGFGEKKPGCFFHSRKKRLESLTFGDCFGHCPAGEFTRECFGAGRMSASGEEEV